MPPNPANHVKPDWLVAVEREAAIRSALILEGNVQDIFFDYTQREYLALPQLLVRMFERNAKLNFTLLGTWDQADGLRFGDDKAMQRFKNAVAGTSQQAGSHNGHSYDMGNQQPPQNPTGNRLYAEPVELLAAARRLFGGENERPALILDYTQHLVTQPDHPDPNERGWILEFKKAISTGTTRVNSDTLRYNKGILVLLTTSLSNIPPAVYQGDPRVKVINVGTPSRPERKEFFHRHTDDLRCERPNANPPEDPLTSIASGREELADTFASLTDRFNMIDLKQLLALSMTTGEPLSPEKLLNLYRLGDQRSPWEELSEDRLRRVENVLGQRVIGQNGAVKHSATMMKRAYLGLSGVQHSSKKNKPKGVMFMVGPTGVGKTELAKAIAEFLFGDETAFIRFDMSEYNHEHSDQKLIGAPPGYVGFEQGGQLTNAVRKNPFSVILFDEIEKAHGKILDKFLQILEDGRLTDSHGETVYFSECVIIFTSNIGASSMPDTDAHEEIKQHFLSAVEEHFVSTLNRPEILNRLGDNIVCFNKITDNSFRKSIIKKKIAPLEAHLRERFGVAIDICEAAHESLLNSTKSRDGGRGLLNSLERMLINPLSGFIFDHMHQLRKGRYIDTAMNNGNINFEIKEQSNDQRYPAERS